MREMKGKLFGISTGPGDPELLTLKAINKIKQSDVIAIPQSGKDEGKAFSIVSQYLKDKEILKCYFAMKDDMQKRKTAREIIASDIMRILDSGRNVGFITLGDATTYSTYMYIHEIITDNDYQAEIIPGVTSYAAAAAALGIALCEADEILTIIPARHKENIDELLNYPGNKIIMKSGKNLSNVLMKLKERKQENNTRIAHCVTMPNQCLSNNIDSYEKSSQTSYFTVAIVKSQRKDDIYGF